MSNEIANQLLVRVQNEMVRNISTVKKQLIEWLERPESGGVDTFAEQLSEVAGALALLSCNNAARLCKVLADSVKTLDAKFRDKTVEQHEFSEMGAEIASGLLLLNDYIDRLVMVEPADERLLSEAIQAIESILAGNGVVKVTAQPKVDYETYQALAAKVSEILETSRNQIEQYGVNSSKQFDVNILIGHNKNLIGLFEVLDLKAPQLLLKQINQMLGEQLSETQWIDIAEAMILVEETLKYIQLGNQNSVDDYSSAIIEQSSFSRKLEIQKVLRDTGTLARNFYEKLRKNFMASDTIAVKPPLWKEAALHTSHFASVSQLVGETNLSAVLNQLALQFAEMSLQVNHKVEAYPAVADVLVAIEYIFNDLSDTAKVNATDVHYLKQVSDKLAVFYAVSAQAKTLLQEFVHREAEVDASELEENEHGGLGGLLEGLDALEAHFDGVVDLQDVEEVVEEQEEETELPLAVSVVSQALESDTSDIPAPEGKYQAYFANKSLNDLSSLEVPTEKENFLESHDSAVMDDEIREFFLEELNEKVQEIYQELAPWKASPDDSEHIGTVRRAFHTIKGSGRTVGYEALGECAWQHEQMLNRVIDKTFAVNPTVQNIIADTVDLLKILTVGGGFVEQKAALLTQASLAEYVTKYLIEHPDADNQIIAQYANSVREALTEDAKSASQVIENIKEKLVSAPVQSSVSSDEFEDVNAQSLGHDVVESTQKDKVASGAKSSAKDLEHQSAPEEAKPVPSSVEQQARSEAPQNVSEGGKFGISAEEAEAKPDDLFEVNFEQSASDATVQENVELENEITHEHDNLVEFDIASLSADEASQPVEQALPKEALNTKDALEEFLADIPVSSGNSVPHSEMPSESVESGIFAQSFYSGKTLDDSDNLSAMKGTPSVNELASEAVDKNVLSIFLEEFDSNVEQIGQTLPKWKEYPQNKEYLDKVRRAFHTIKGSGKMMNYQSLGDFAWQYENLLDAIDEAYFQTNSLVLNSVSDANDLLKILRTADGFVEHKSALAMQGKIAEQIREKLMATPQISEEEQAQFAQALYAHAGKDSIPEHHEQVHIDATIHPETAEHSTDQEKLAALAQEVSHVIESGLSHVDMTDEDDKAVLRDVVSSRIARQEKPLSDEQLAALSAQVSQNLKDQVSAEQLAELLSQPEFSPNTPIAPSMGASLPENQASAYRHMADMLQRSLLAQPLDADDEAILAQQFNREIERLGHSITTDEQREQLQAQLSMAFSGTKAESAAYDELLNNVMARVGTPSSPEAALGVDEAMIERLSEVVSRMSATQTDSDDVEILRHQVQTAIEEYAQSEEQQRALEKAVAAELKKKFSQEEQASALLNEAFADVEDTFSEMNSVDDLLEEMKAPEQAQEFDFASSAGEDSSFANEQIASASDVLGLDDLISTNDANVGVSASGVEESESIGDMTEASAPIVEEDENALSAGEQALADAMLHDMAQRLAEQVTPSTQDIAPMFEEALANKTEIEKSQKESAIAQPEAVDPRKIADYVDSKSGDIDLTHNNRALVPSLSSARAPKASNLGNRLSDELSRISTHPTLDNAVGAKAGGVEKLGLAKFLSAVDNFETLSRQIEEDSSPEIIDNLLESVYDIEDSLEVNNVPDWIWRMLDAIEQLLLTYRSQGSNVSLNAASILRQSIDLIEHFDEEGNAEDANQTINSLMQSRKELGATATREVVREPVVIATTVPSTAAPVQQNWDEWILDPNKGTDLAETFLDEAVILLGRSQLETESWEKNLNNLTHLDAIRRDMHTLKGGARMAGYLALGDLTHAIESMVESIVDGHSEANAQAVAVLNGALWQATIMLDAVRDGYLPQTDPYMLNNISHFLGLPLPYPEVAEKEERLKEAAITDKEETVEISSEALVETDEVAVSEVVEVEEALVEEPKEDVAISAFDENIDPVLVDIFIDEAQELIDQAGALFSQDLKNTEIVEELKRNMHTLKGGARLVGLTAIGDTSHLMESVIEQMGDYNETKMRQAKNLLNMGHEALYSMLDSVLRKEMPTPATSLNESLNIFAKEARFVQPNFTQDNLVEEAPVEKDGTQQAEHIEQAHIEETAQTKEAVRAEEVAQSEVAVSRVAEVETVEEVKSVAEAVPEKVDVVESAQVEPAKVETKPEVVEVMKAEAQHSEIQRYVRVDAELLDELVAMIGETAIMRSRLENVSSESAFNLNELTRIANRIDEQMRRLDNETEAQMLFRRESQATDDEHFDPLEMDRFSEIQQLSRQLAEAINDLKNVQETLTQENALIRNLSIQQGFIQRGIQERLLTTQLIRFDVNEARLKRLVRQTAKSVDKDIELIIEGGHVELERRLIEDVLPAIEHMIRNSVGHGIETASERVAAGKPSQGIIKLIVAAKASNVEISILDDGRGFDYDRIREKARNKGWLDENRANDHQYLNSLLMRSGFSTAQVVTQLSGRGVGMDVVNEMVKQRRGQLLAESIPGKGAQFTILMPFTMSIAEVLLVEIAEQTYAVPMNAIAAIVQVAKEDLQSSHDGEEIYTQYDGMDYRLYVLGDYFNPEHYQFSVETTTAPALFINASNEPTAFFVDRIANRVEVIVKNVNRQVLNIPGISGATILGDGNVVPVLEPLDLARRIGNLTQQQVTEVVEEVFVPNILVVDDSVTMRKVSTRLLERNGYIAESAKDGLDAIDVLQHFTPDLILLDIEMPRMDGFEFANYVRQNTNIPNVPIIMITSRTGDKHRERAEQIGVQGYLGKPYREDILIETIESLLGEKANG